MWMLDAFCHFRGGVKTIRRQSLSIVTNFYRGSVYIYISHFLKYLLRIKMEKKDL